MKELSKEEMKQEWTHEETDSYDEDKKRVNDMVKDLAGTVKAHGGQYKEVSKGNKGLGVMPYKRGYFVRDRSLKNSREDVFYISNRGVDTLTMYLEKDEIKNQVKEAIEKKFGEGSYDKLPKDMIKDIRKKYKEALEDAKESKIKKILKAQKEDIRGILDLYAQKEDFKALSEDDGQKDEGILYEEAIRYEENSGANVVKTDADDYSYDEMPDF